MQSNITSLARRIERLRAQLDPPVYSAQLPVQIIDDAGEVIYATPFAGLPPSWRRMGVKEYFFDASELEGSEP